MLGARLAEVKREKVDQEQYVLEAIECEVPPPQDDRWRVSIARAGREACSIEPVVLSWVLMIVLAYTLDRTHRFVWIDA